MVYNIAVCITYLLELLIAYIFFSQITIRKFSSIYCFFIGSVIFETGALFDIVLSNTVWFNVVYFFVINFVFCSTCFKIKISRALFYALVLDIVSGALEFASIFLISVFTGTHTTAYLDNILFFVLDVAISKLLYFFTCLIITNFSIKEKSNFKFPVGLYFYPLVIVASLIVFWNICSQSEINKKIKFH